MNKPFICAPSAVMLSIPSNPRSFTHFGHMHCPFNKPHSGTQFGMGPNFGGESTMLEAQQLGHIYFGFCFKMGDVLFLIMEQYLTLVPRIAIYVTC